MNQNLSIQSQKVMPTHQMELGTADASTSALENGSGVDRQLSRYDRVDLHCHSTCSDGTFDPQTVVKLAHAAGVSVLALTDHDTTAGIALAKAEAEACGIQLLNGVEISCTHVLSGGYGRNKERSKVIHVVGLGFSNMALMSEALDAVQESRAKRGYAIVEKLAQLFDASAQEMWAQVVALAGGNPLAVGRSHLAKMMLERGLVKDMQQAFDRYLADNKPAYVPIETLSMSEAIALIHSAGGKAVLAHPTRYDLSANRVRRLIADFAQYGGDACELPSTDEPPSIRQMIDRCIAEHELAVSIGSDFHGSSMPWRRLGHVPTPLPQQYLIINDFFKSMPME